MGNKNNNLGEFIIVDLETIGLEKETGKIIEIAALRIKNWEIIDEFVQLVNPGIKIPRVTTNLTGIRNIDIIAQPAIDKCLGPFLDFIGNLPIAGHNILSFDKPFIEYNLKRCKIKRSLDNLTLDTLELAIFLLPELRRHKLEYLYEYLLSKNTKQQHRAKDDCEMTLAVLKELKNIRDKKWDYGWLRHAGAIAKNEGWPWADFILDCEDFLKLGKHICSYLPVENYLETLKWDKMKKIESSYAEASEGRPIDASPSTKSTGVKEEKRYIKVDNQEIKNIFSENNGAGSLKNVLGRQYEYRKQQEDMAIQVAESINNDKNLVIEAPTGCGKSLAYLAPAVCLSLKNGNSPVVISTYTNALQDQLFENDFKSISRIFGDKVRITVAKGREHYVCLRKFKNYIEGIFSSHAETTEGKARFAEALGGRNKLSKKLFAVFLANWIIRNKNNNCDLDRFPFWLKNKTDNFSESGINSARDSCQRHFCEFYDKCLINKLKLATRESNIIVSNHSLVFSDPWDNPSIFSVLPNDFKVLVIDEAINIEDAATSASTETFSRNEFKYLIKDFFDKAHPKKGFLRRIENHLLKTGDEKPVNRIKKIQSTADKLLDDNSVLFNIVLNEIRGRTLEYDDRQEIFPYFLAQANVQLSNLALGLSELMAFLDMLYNLYCCQNKNGFCQEIKNYKEKFRKYHNFISVLNELNKNDFIFFKITNAALDDLSLNYCHKDIGKYLDSNLYGKGLKSIVFTSATLAYDDNFDFINKIWGLNLILKEKLTYVKLPYLFDYEKQCALFLVNELPNRSRETDKENQKKFYPLTADFLKKLIIANNGSALLLFTNNKDVVKFGELLAHDLENNNIPLYSTAKTRDPKIMSGNKSSIVQEFKECVESCLIGTAGLREGINVPGDSLELVVIVKMPFDVPTDPINRNRQLLYGGFSGYSLPHCLFNIKQAFGRLIRTKNDSGFVFVLDARIMSYAGAIKNNMPQKLNILNLGLKEFENFNSLLAKTKGMKDRVEKIIKVLRK